MVRKQRTLPPAPCIMVATTPEPLSTGCASHCVYAAVRPLSIGRDSALSAPGLCQHRSMSV